MPVAATKEASEPPPVDAAPSDHPRTPPGPGQLDEMDHVGRALHRRTPHERRELDGDTGDHVVASRAAMPSSTRASSPAVRARALTSRWRGGDGVRCRPTRNQADVDRVPTAGSARACRPMTL